MFPTCVFGSPPPLRRYHLGPAVAGAIDAIRASGDRISRASRRILAAVDDAPARLAA
jgi:hypothetical protein